MGTELLGGKPGDPIAGDPGNLGLPMGLGAVGTFALPTGGVEVGVRGGVFTEFSANFPGPPILLTAGDAIGEAAGDSTNLEIIGEFFEMMGESLGAMGESLGIVGESLGSGGGALSREIMGEFLGMLGESLGTMGESLGIVGESLGGREGDAGVTEFRAKLPPDFKTGELTGDAAAGTACAAGFGAAGDAARARRGDATGKLGLETVSRGGREGEEVGEFLKLVDLRAWELGTPELGIPELGTGLLGTGAGDSTLFKLGVELELGRVLGTVGTAGTVGGSLGIGGGGVCEFSARFPAMTWLTVSVKCV